jgi:hypothetical protein
MKMLPLGRAFGPLGRRPHLSISLAARDGRPAKLGIYESPFF